MEDTIKILGARVHNLKNVDLEIPRRKLVVVTGLSGSGKSSLAFDTIYAEGQRRYMETLSTYARQFVGTMERPDVDKITGLSPVVAIEQKTTNKNPRSTVGTVTEINDFLRLLYARASRAYSPVTGEEMVHYTDDQIAELILTGFAGRKIALMAPIVKGRKGHYRELFESLAKKGYIYARIDGEIREISSGMRLDRYKIHTIDLVVDRLVVSEESRERLMTSLKESMRQGKGTMAVHDYGTGQQRFYSRHLMCPSTGVAFEDPAPHTFSFNSPKGACPHCNGLGEEAVFDVGKIIPDARLSLREGAVGPLGKYRNNMLFAILEMLGRRYDFTLDDPVESFSEEALNAVLYGDSEPLTVDLQEFSSSGGRQFLSWEGVAEYIGRTEDDDSKHGQKWRDQFLVYRKCSVCGGSRLRKESLQFRVAGKNIAEVSAMSISEFSEWVPTIEKQLSEKEWKIAQEIVKEIRERLRFLMDVGLGYLSLARSSRSLSGGESQRIRLATQIGSKLVNVLYILDEPSIGLHQRDNQRLIRSLEELRDAGNSVIVVEHDEDMMRAADFIVDVGPRAGRKGGNIVAAGTFDDILRSDTITADYLMGRRRIEIPETLRKGTGGRIVIRGARGNNLKNVTAEFPLGKFICVTGVSGSGKSTLVNETLRPILARELYRSFDQPLEYDGAEGLEHIDKLVVVDQSPIGRTPRSNPATYSNVFSDIRKLFEMTPDAQIRGFKAGRFSFNVKGGRCEEWGGRADHRDELPARRLRALQGVRRPPLQPRDARSEVQGQKYRRRAEHDGQHGRGVFREHPQYLPETPGHSGGGPRLPDARAALHDAVGRRESAHQALVRAFEARHGPHALYPGRAYDGASFRGHPSAAGGTEQARRPRQYGHRHRTQPRRHQGRRPYYRYRSRGRGGRRGDHRRGHAARGGAVRGQLHGSVPQKAGVVASPSVRRGALP